MAREFERTHPWISFQFDLRSLDPATWKLLGEAESKCEHLAGVPLRPDVAKKMHEVYLSKGIHGTTSIEGNTLSELEVLERVRGNLPLPPSREYLGHEIDNILGICNKIIADVIEDRRIPLSSERVSELNRRILDGLPLQDDVRPGMLRDHSVVVARYRAAPARDLPYLMDRFCEWLESGFQSAVGDAFLAAVLRAVLAHLYVAWIHPFGDGNGRTARVIEFQLLVQAGVPVPAAHLLSDHYNKTRDRYYQVLDRTSRGNHPVQEFVKYAIEGFVDELREQIGQVREQQMSVTWENFVHDMFRDQETAAKRRQKHLVLDLPIRKAVSIGDIKRLTPRLAEAYSGKQQKTVTRDLNELAAIGLVRRVGHNDRFVIANREIISAFLPVRARAKDGSVE